MTESKKIHFKVCVIGEKGTGKLMLIDRFVENKYYDHPRTIGPALIYDKNLLVDEKVVSLQLWHFRAYEFNRVTSLFKGGILTIDITRYTALDTMEEWILWFREHCGSKPLLLIGTKLDLSVEIGRAISKEDTLEKVREHDLIGYIETSAKENIRVEEAFTLIVRELLELRKEGE